MKERRGMGTIHDWHGYPDTRNTVSSYPTFGVDEMVGVTLQLFGVY